MFIAGRAAEIRILDAVQRAGYPDITMAQARIAARIGPDGTRLGALAEQAQVAKQTATALVDRLERAGYVERVVDPTDARAGGRNFAERAADKARGVEDHPADTGSRVADAARRGTNKVVDAVDNLKDRIDGNPASKPGPDPTDRRA